MDLFFLCWGEEEERRRIKIEFFLLSFVVGSKVRGIGGSDVVRGRRKLDEVRGGKRGRPPG